MGSHTGAKKGSEAQIDLVAWARDLEREHARVAAVYEERARRRGYLVFASDPSVSPDDPSYCVVYATEARTPNQAAAKIRPLAPGGRMHTYLGTGKYKHELADAPRVA